MVSIFQSDYYWLTGAVLDCATTEMQCNVADLRWSQLWHCEALVFLVTKKGIGEICKWQIKNWTCSLLMVKNPIFVSMLSYFTLQSNVSVLFKTIGN